MKIVITGALGHIGSRLIREAAVHFPNSELELIDNLSTLRYGSLFSLPETARYSFHQKDVTKDLIKESLDGADAVIHLAAMTDAPSSVARSKEFFDNNLGGTRNIAEQCTASGVPLVFLSSTSVYGTSETEVDEACMESELNPQSPYAECKLSEERLILEYIKRGLKGVTIRLGTIFGISPGMRFHTAVNRFCWQASLGSPLSVWRSAQHQVRPYCDLTDAINAMFFLIEKREFSGQTYNVVTLNESVEGVVSEIRQWIPSVKVTLVDEAIMNQLSFKVSSEKIKKLGFVTQGSLSRGVQETIRLLKNMNSAHEK